MAKKNIETRKGKVKKKKKKNWTKIITSKDFNSLEIGESLCETPQSLIGKTLSLNLMHLLNDPKRQNIRILFRVKEVMGDKVVAYPEKYLLSESLVKRLVRREGTKMGDSFIAESSEKTNFRVKPLLCAKSKIHRSVAASLRSTIRAFVRADFAKKSDSEIMKSVIDNRLQREIRGAVKKVYPLAV